MTVRMDGDVLALTFAKDGTVTPDVSRGFIIKVEGGPTKGRLAYFFFFAFSGFCAAHFSIIWKKIEASSGW